MNFQREAIFAALFAQLQVLLNPVTLPAPSTVVTLSRRLKHWADVGPSQRPAVFVAQGKENIPRRKRGTPAVYTLRAEIYVYVSTAGGQTPGTVLNPILDAIQAAFDSALPDGTNTLGGLVQECWIEGEITTYEGTLGDDEVAVLPVFITVC